MLLLEEEKELLLQEDEFRIGSFLNKNCSLPSCFWLKFRFCRNISCQGLRDKYMNLDS